MDYIKTNSIGLLVVAVFALGGILGWFQPSVAVYPNVNVDSGDTFGNSSDVTTITNPWTFEENVTLSTATFTNTGGTSVLGAASFAGLVTLNAGQLRSYTNATTSNASLALIQADILNYDTVLMTPQGSQSTITFPASSTLTSFVPTAGDMAKQCWFNATTTTTNLGMITFAAGTGIDLELASSTATQPLLTLRGTDSACFNFIRKANTDIVMQMTTFTDGD